MENDKMQAFLDSFDFMRLGQAITHNNQNAAMMILSNLQSAAEEAGAAELFATEFKNLRGCILCGEVQNAQDILAVVTAKRVRLLQK